MITITIILWFIGVIGCQILMAKDGFDDKAGIFCMSIIWPILAIGFIIMKSEYVWAAPWHIATWYINKRKTLELIC